MKDIPIADVRNFTLLGHTGSGKTTLIDAILHDVGLNNRVGNPGDGTSFADWTEEEKERQLTIWAKPFDVFYTTAAGRRVNLVMSDTPGFADFYGQAVSASSVADACMIAVDASSGLQVGTTRAWHLCETLGLPRGIVITGIDKENANYEETLTAIQAAWGERCLPVILPVDGGKSVLSVIASKEVPDELAERVASIKQVIVEDAAETDDTLIEKYLAGEELQADELAHGLHLAVNNRTLIPVFPVASLSKVGVHELLEGICRYFPSPEDHGAKDAEGNAIDVSPSAPFCGEVWRTLNDPYAGNLSYVRVYGGTLRANTEVFNSTKGEKERVGSMFMVNGKEQKEVQEAEAGDVVALPKLKHTGVNDTLCAAGQTIRLKTIDFPKPVTSYAVYVKNKGEEDKLASGLQRVADDDPTIRIQRNDATHELVMSGLGDIHLDHCVQQLKKKGNVEVELRTPKVAYQETITGKGEGHYKHKKQSGGRGQFGEVYLRVEPLPDGDEEWFVNAIVGGAIPSNFIPGVEKGLVAGRERGALAGYPVKKIRITVYDGKHHDVDSSEIAFKIAASRALREAMSSAKPVLLEPVMKLSVMVPDQFMGDVTGDLNHRRGRIMGIDAVDGMQVLHAEAPQAELFRYSSELRSMTGGRGSFEMEFTRYDVVPGNVAQKVIDAADHVDDDED